MTNSHDEKSSHEKDAASWSSHHVSKVREAMHGAAMLLGTSKLLEEKGAESYAQFFHNAAHSIYDLTDELQQKIPNFEEQVHGTGHKVLPGSPDRDDVFVAEYKQALKSLLEVELRYQ